jgi:hypothetical protein
VFRFPGGGTQFPQGADKYIDHLASVIPIAANELVARWLGLAAATQPTRVRTSRGEIRGVAQKKSPSMSHAKAQV